MRMSVARFCTTKPTYSRTGSCVIAVAEKVGKVVQGKETPEEAQKALSSSHDRDPSLVSSRPPNASSLADSPPSGLIHTKLFSHPLLLPQTPTKMSMFGIGGGSSQGGGAVNHERMEMAVTECV
jgi:hypothetical protein